MWNVLGAEVEEKLLMRISGLAHMYRVCFTCFFANTVEEGEEKWQSIAKYIAWVSHKIEIR